MNSVIDKIPKLAIAGLTTATIFVQSSTGQADISNEYQHELYRKSESLKSEYVSQRYGILSDVEINPFNLEVQKVIGNDDDFKAFLIETIAKLEKTYTVFGSSVEVFNDPNEGYKQIRINVFSVDEDKFEKYLSFVDSWIETIPENYLDKIVVSVA
jgi:hypothetical protein